VRAVVLEGPRRARLCELPEPRLARGEVLVGIERAGVCGSDLAVFSGSRPAEYPLILGHEGVGRILDAGDSQHVPGSRVVIEPNVPCGRCSICRRGHGNVCPEKRSLGMNWPGVFAERVAVPADFVHALPAEMAVDDAVGIEPLAVALHAFGLGQVAEGDPVAVVGCGAEGLLLVQVAVALGARVLAADLQSERLEAARRLGAERVLAVSPDGVSAELLDETRRGWSPAVVFEAAGAASALELALQVAAPGGRVVAVGLASTPMPLQPLAFVRRGLSLIGSLIYDHPTDFLQTIELVRRGQIRPSHLVSETLDDLAALPAALGALLQREPSGKTLVSVAAEAHT
jgi:L-iditol 2-dehydrogenase/L-gulonate 5-dehydrogenase